MRQGCVSLCRNITHPTLAPIIFAPRGFLCYGQVMDTTPVTTAFDRGVRPLLRIVLLDRTEAVLNFRPDPTLQIRIEELATKSTEGELTEQERAEYEGYVRANKFIAILQRQAKQMVGATS